MNNTFINLMFHIIHTCFNWNNSVCPIAETSPIVLLLDHGLPLALPLSDGEAVDLGLDLRPPLAHVVLDIEHEGVLAEVCIHHLAWGLKAHSRVQVRLQEKESETVRKELGGKGSLGM